MTLAHAIEPTNTADFTPQDMALAEALWLDNALKERVENLVCLLHRMKTEKTVSVTNAEEILTDITEFVHGLWQANELYIQQALTA
jgi:hypothetical protein